MRRAVGRLLGPVLHRKAGVADATTASLADLARRMTQLEGRMALVERQLTALADRLGEGMAPLGRERVDDQGARAAAPGETGCVTARAAAGNSGVDAAETLSMHWRFRGPEDDVKRRQREYLEYFADSGPVLDLGCGRGEFLEVLRDAGITARGVESDLEAVRHCRAKGLDVTHAEALDHLKVVREGTVGGIFCAQLIEHLSPARMLSLIRLSARRLRPGGVALYETPNPQCLAIFAGAFYLDLTHVWPYHPELMKVVMEDAGFAGIQTIFSSPIDPEARLPVLTDARVFGAQTDAYNRAVNLVNHLLLGPQDYAVVGRRRDELP